MNVNDAFRIAIDNSRGVIYNCNMFIVQATGWKDLPGTNTVAYLSSSPVMKKKGFIRLVPVHSG
jgi:hypothetical protein